MQDKKNKNKNKDLNRDQVAELYKDLHKAMATVESKKSAKAQTDDSSAKDLAKMISSIMKSDTGKPRASIKNIAKPQEQVDIKEPTVNMLPVRRSGSRGNQMAIAFVLLFASLRVVVSAMEASEFGAVNIAEAAIVQPSRAGEAVTFSREDMQILTSLDSRRVELNEKGKMLESKEHEIESRDREFAAKLTELRELSSELKQARQSNEKQKSSQLESLANVYGSMTPKEAAELMESLDETIALDLLSRMPEKRVAQILAMMSRDKALMMTKMFSQVRRM